MKGYSVQNIKKVVLELFIGAPVCMVVLPVEMSVQKLNCKISSSRRVQVTLRIM